MSWKFFARTHTHQGIDKDGSSKISYNDLTDALSADDSTITNTSGTLGVKQTSGVYARLTSTQVIANTTWTKLAIAVEDKDELAEYNNSTYTFTADGDGWRHIAFCGSFAPHTIGYRMITIYVDGVKWDQGRTVTKTGSSNPARMNIDLDIPLTDGQTLEVYVYQTIGGNLNFDGATLSIKGYVK